MPGGFRGRGLGSPRPGSYIGLPAIPARAFFKSGLARVPSCGPAEDDGDG